MDKKRKVIKEIMGWVVSIVGAFLIVVLLNSKVFAKAQVQQSSMENTLINGQQLIVDKLSYNFTEPKRGDIIIFFEDEEKGTILDDALRTINSIAVRFSGDKDIEDSRLVKRVIGVEGDKIDIKDGYVYLNGEKLEETYTKGETIKEEFKLPVKVGKDELFVLGDNRIVSKDSRCFGLVNLKQVEGKAIYRVYPFNQMGKVN
jgi:signal peptidase I